MSHENYIYLLANKFQYRVQLTIKIIWGAQMDKLLGNLEGMMKIFQPKPPKFVFLNDEIKHTKYLFGSLESIRKIPLLLVDKNDEGDCLCRVPDGHMIDVDHRDIQMIR